MAVSQLNVAMPLTMRGYIQGITRSLLWTRTGCLRKSDPLEEGCPPRNPPFHYQIHPGHRLFHHRVLLATLQKS